MTTSAEPNLELKDIQGNIARGYRLPGVAHLFGTIERTNVDLWRAALQRLSAYATQDDGGEKPRLPLNIGISYAGLELLVPPVARQLSSFAAYADGMPRRGLMLGDEPNEYRGDWQARHVWLTIHAEPGALDDSVQRLKAVAGVPLEVKKPYGQALVQDGHWIEHFGFRDDISQPAVKGAANEAKALPGGGKRVGVSESWSPIAPGEFLLGYENEAGENALDGVSAAAAKILENGTFAVFRELVQDVPSFRAEIDRVATHWNTCPNELMARLVGRRPDGDSLAMPGQQTEFTYHDDPRGSRCPLGAHVRRVNPRLNGEHRLIRRGVPFGTLLRQGQQDDGSVRGLYFVVFNASIENQFEFVQQVWLNKAAGVLPGSRDPLAGGGAARGGMVIEGDVQTNRDPMVFDLPKFVSCRGGQYYLMPGIRALQRIAGVHHEQIGKRSILTLEQQL